MRTKYLLFFFLPILFSGCSSTQRYHEYQNERLEECAYKKDDEYFRCLDGNKENYEQYKAEQADKNES